MKKRKNIIIDKEIQLKTIFNIIGVVFITMIICISAVGTNIFFINQKLNSIAKNEELAFITSSDIYKSLILYSHNKQLMNLQKINKNFSKELSNSSINMNKNVKAINEIVQNNNILLMVLAFFFVLLCATIIYIIKHKTDRILGPAFLINKYMNQIIDGENPEFRPLRKDDGLKDFYYCFCEMANNLLEEKNNKV